MQQNFSRAAATYDEAAVLARETGQRMAARLDYVKIQPARMADIGCATGDGIRALQQRYPAALPVAIDVAHEMLRQVRVRAPLLQRFARRAPRLLNADARALPLATGSLDLVWSNLMLHWLDDPLPALREMQRVLAVDGLLMFAMLGPDTLRELRAACHECGIEPPLRRFPDMHDVGNMLVAAGFADPVMDMEMLTLTYATPRGLLRDQRHLGVRDALLGHLPWRDWRRLLQFYAAQHPSLPARFEIVYGHAWKPEPRQTDDGRSIIHFEPRAHRAPFAPLAPRSTS
ncbi:MAG: methyltransferase domain-containing protein [Sterolibacterium sp.]|jgi:malonyl-CoA O-methyltransferase|nr:methyltransferase domain-containing protein [Sterolibacterium sp.]